MGATMDMGEGGEFRMFENLGVPVSFGGHNLPPLVEIGVTDLPKSGGPQTVFAWDIDNNHSQRSGQNV